MNGLLFYFDCSKVDHNFFIFMSKFLFIIEPSITVIRKPDEPLHLRLMQQTKFLYWDTSEIRFFYELLTIENLSIIDFSNVELKI